MCTWRENQALNFPNNIERKKCHVDDKKSRKYDNLVATHCVNFPLRQGELAQMVERSIRIREARGSIPRFSTRNFEKASTRKQATTRKFAPKRCEIIYYYMHHLHLVLLMQ